MKVNKNFVLFFIAVLLLAIYISGLESLGDTYSIANTNNFVLAPEAENVLVVYNIEYIEDEDNNDVQDSYQVAIEYASAREIPNENICGISTNTSEVISREEYDEAYDVNNLYDRHIKQDIEDCLTHEGIKEKVRYIVLVRGIPLKINTYSETGNGYADFASVDSEVTLLFTDTPIHWRYGNPYRFYGDQYRKFETRFNSFKYSIGGITISYLVTRIDGYTLSDALNVIERSLNSDQSMNYQWVLDDDPNALGTGYDTMLLAKDVLTQQGLSYYISYDNTVNSLTTEEDANYTPVIGYTSHGIYASGIGPNGIYNGVLDFGFANGAVYTSWESFNGYSFRDPSATNHNAVADWISVGGTAGIGNVYEPWASGISEEFMFFSRLAAGYPLADAAYSSIPFISFVNVVAGDPLMTINDFKNVRIKAAHFDNAILSYVNTPNGKTNFTIFSDYPLDKVTLKHYKNDVLSYEHEYEVSPSKEVTLLADFGKWDENTKHDIEINATNSEGESKLIERTFYVDLTKPSIIIYTPEEDEIVYTSNGELFISYSATDSNFMQSIIFLDGNNVGYSLNNGYYSKHLSGLEYGEHYLMIWAKDKAGHINTKGLTFYLVEE